MSTRTALFSLWVVLMATIVTADETLDCLDGDGNKVDFWYVIKQPGGWDYHYALEGQTWKNATDKLTDETSPVHRTFWQLYKTEYNSSTFALWNDQHPDGKKYKGPHAHAKGMLGYRNGLGFWMTHSIPRFPSWNRAPPFTNAEEEHTYGQSFLCISIDKDGLDTITAQKTVDWVSVYASMDGDNAGENFKRWAIDGKHIKDKNTSVMTMHSRGGQRFTSFAKSAYWDDDLWDNLVAPHFKKSFITETWQNGVGRMASNCESEQTIENALTLGFPDGDNWKETQDHSKWAVSTDGKVFCVGDINRQTGQRNRGGGATCIMKTSMAQQVLDKISSKEACSKKDALVV